MGENSREVEKGRWGRSGWTECGEMMGVRHQGQPGAERQGTGVRGATGWVVNKPLKEKIADRGNLEEQAENAQKDERWWGR